MQWPPPEAKPGDDLYLDGASAWWHPQTWSATVYLERAGVVVVEVSNLRRGILENHAKTDRIARCSALELTGQQECDGAGRAVTFDGMRDARRVAVGLCFQKKSTLNDSQGCGSFVLVRDVGNKVTDVHISEYTRRS